MKKKISRRKILKGAASLAALTAAGCTTSSKKEDRGPSSTNVAFADNAYEFIVVGSGAGGGPLACRLAQAGFRVLLIEAGSAKSNLNSQAPVLHAKATDDPAINWSFFVQRYSDPVTAKRNSKYVPGKGIYYPRGSALGGSTVMNAMITLYPDHQDWEHIRQLTGDDSWSAKEMWRHFERLQVNLPEGKKPVWDYFRAQFQRGWLELSQASISLLFQDPMLLEIVFSALRSQGITKEVLKKLYTENLNIKLNPNTIRETAWKFDGFYNIPMSVSGGVRSGVRNFILDTASKYSDQLKLQTNSLVKKLLFHDQDKSRVIGVEYAEGANLYGAHQEYQASSTYTTKTAFATREVILCGGAFNTPQLLQLSGIGDSDWLRSHGVEPRVHLPAVGSNLQDRYEVGVVTQFPDDFSLFKRCGFGAADDECMTQYMKHPDGHLYGTNGVVISMIKRSDPSRPTPDLCVFGVPGSFRGYYPKWSEDSYKKDHFTWLILKGHAKSRSGTVKIRSNDFRAAPEINFRAFEDGMDLYGEDMKAVIEGIHTARNANSYLGRGTEVVPGDKIRDENQLREFIKNESWGHHASCTSPMGRADDEKAVVDSEFRVRKTEGLRIVDASIFPEIPGLFIMAPILTVSEKAAQLIIKKYKV